MGWNLKEHLQVQTVFLFVQGKRTFKEAEDRKEPPPPPNARIAPTLFEMQASYLSVGFLLLHDHPMCVKQ